MAKRMRRKLLGCLLAVLGAIPLALEGAPALALNLMTWNIQGATNMRNGGEVGTWQFVIGTMRENNKQVAAIQEAGNPDEIERQLRPRARAGTFRSETITDVPGLPTGFVIRRIRVQIQGDNYTIYVLDGSAADPNGKRVALVLRNVEGDDSLRVEQIPDSPRPALGIRVQGTTYFSIHSPASGRALEAGRAALSLIANRIDGNWVALGDWNVNIGNANNPRNPRGGNPSTPFGADIANPDLVGAQVYRSDRNTQNARADGGPQNALDYAFANYPFANPQGTVIRQPGQNEPSDHLPVNYDDTPIQAGGGPPSPPAPPNADLDGQCVRISNRESGLELSASSADPTNSLQLIDLDSLDGTFENFFADRFCLSLFSLDSGSAAYVVRPDFDPAPTLQNNGRVILSEDSTINGFDAWILRPDGQGNFIFINLQTSRPLTVTRDGATTRAEGGGTPFFAETVNE